MKIISKDYIPVLWIGTTNFENIEYLFNIILYYNDVYYYVIYRYINLFVLNRWIKLRFYFYYYLLSYTYIYAWTGR